MSKKRLKIFISGQKYFGAEVLRLCIEMGHEVVGVCCPVGDKYIGKLASINGITIINAGSFTADSIPPETDLGITAHSFEYIGKRARYAPRLGWVGYHPSLLPRHRGRSSIEWAIKMGDPITGGTIYWLNSGIDRGDIAYQDWAWISPSMAQNPREGARELWRECLMQMGVDLFRVALMDISEGIIKRQPQRNDVSTFEPSCDVKDIFKPDCLMIEQKN